MESVKARIGITGRTPQDSISVALYVDIPSVLTGGRSVKEALECLRERSLELMESGELLLDDEQSAAPQQQDMTKDPKKDDPTSHER